MLMSRRAMLTMCAASLASVRAAEIRKRLGIVTYSLSIRIGADRAANLNDPQSFLTYCQKLGAGGMQHSLGVRDKLYVEQLHRQAADHGMFVEGSIRLPRDHADMQRFSDEVRTAKDAGATVLRTVALNGRRYETFNDAASFRQWSDKAEESLRLAAPVMAQHQMRLALENHKDRLAADLVDVIKRLNSKFIGVCVDTGNNVALLEDPHQVVETLAPYAFSVHLKDMAVEEYEEGFLLSEVPLGEGFLDLKRIVSTLRKAHPEIQFGLEMITRDPLKIPCLGRKYWATFESTPASHLAQALAMVRKNKSPKPLPVLSKLPKDQQIAVEEDNVRKCLEYAKKHLEL